MPASSHSCIRSLASACASRALYRSTWPVSCMHFETKADPCRQSWLRCAMVDLVKPSQLGGRASRRTPGEDATSKERAFERTVAMHAAPAKACHFSRGKHVAERCAVGLEHARGKVGLQTAQRLAREDP